MKCCNYRHHSQEVIGKKKPFFNKKKGTGVKGAVYNWVNGVFYNKSLLVGPQLKVRASFPHRLQH